MRVRTSMKAGVLAALVWFSSTLAPLRIYQVDECQNLYMARIVATGRASEFFTNASLFLLGPLGERIAARLGWPEDGAILVARMRVDNDGGCKPKEIVEALTGARPDGKVVSTGTQASHILSSLAASNALVDAAPATVLAAGTNVNVLTW